MMTATQPQERMLSLCGKARLRLAARLQLLACRRPVPGAFSMPVAPGTLLHSDGKTMAGADICCFAHYDPQSVVDPTVTAYLRSIGAAGFRIVFISSAPDINASQLDDIRPLCARILVRRNAGFDFASWACAFMMFPELFCARSMLIANDSVWQVGSLMSVFSAMESVPCDFWGMTESRERRPHLQSYFLLFRKTALRSPEFQRFWKNVRALGDKKLIIRRYETTLTLRLALAGLKPAAYVPACWLEDYGRVNPTMQHWFLLPSRYGSPLLKRQLLLENPIRADVHDWETFLPQGCDTCAIAAHAGRLGVSLPHGSRRAESKTSSAAVDILLPAYNGAAYLPELLRSVAAQQGVRPRIIMRDDNSTDETPRILRIWAAQNADTLFLSGERLGVVGNVNRLLENSQAGYFSLADQDDIWLPHKTATLLAAMRDLEEKHGHKLPLLVYSDARLVDARGLEKSPSFRRTFGLPPGWGSSLAQSLVMSPALGCTMLGNAALRERLLPLPDEKSIFMHDWWILLVAQALGATHALKSPLLHYRLHADNTLGVRSAWSLNTLHRLKSIHKNIQMTQRQAAELASRYGADIAASDLAICKAWAAMPDLTYFQRLRRCRAYGFTKPWPRRLSFFIFI